MPRPHLPAHLSLQRLRLSHHSNRDHSTSTSPTRTSAPDPFPPPSPPTSKDGVSPLVGLFLRVHVLKGRNLAAKDKNGTSDPFLVLTLGDSKEATPVVPRTLNPEWHSAFDLPITGVESLLLEVQCWDRDRFRKDYMGEFDIALEDIFKNGKVIQEPQWYRLESRRSGRKSSHVSGDVQLQFQIHEPGFASPNPETTMSHLEALIARELGQDDDENDDLSRVDTGNELDDDASDFSVPLNTTSSKAPESVERRKKRRRLARLKRRTKRRAYQFSGQSDIAGVLYLEIQKATDLPPERNAMRTGFDMDPFVVTSFGKKTYRTRVIRHNLNPVFDEKLVFQVLRHEANYSLTFSVIDRDQFSNNDHVGTASFALDTVKRSQPEVDPDTGLYPSLDLTSDSGPPAESTRRSRFRLPMSRSSSAMDLDRSRNSSSNNLPKLGRTSSINSVNGKSKTVTQHKNESTLSVQSNTPAESPSDDISAQNTTNMSQTSGQGDSSPPSLIVEPESIEDPSLRYYAIPLQLTNKDRWDDKHKPMLHVRAKYLPYQALRQQFWRAMLKQYDADDSNMIDKVELTTMLDTLGSTLRDSTIDAFFQRFAKENGQNESLTMDQAVICLEDRLQQDGTPQQGPSEANSIISMTGLTVADRNKQPSRRSSSSGTPLNNNSQTSFVPTMEVPVNSRDGELGNTLPDDDLIEDSRGEEEEHVVEIHECPICHQPRLHKKNTDADIITHIATCASQDWRAVNNLVMGGFVTGSQAQRKWYSKVITKIGYGGYRIGANSANILVQDRITGQINEERMSIYVRLGIRLLYKGLKSREMEKKKTRKLLKSLSLKQGRKYDDPASAAQIPGFIDFHQLNMSEVLLDVPAFKTFNEFFYRKLKPDARPCSAPDRPEIVTSPADCRTVVFNRMEDAQRVWVKGREFSVERLLGDAYPEDAKRYKNSALGIFRLAPQDYHRFHIPVDGVMGEPKLIEGEYYTVNPMAIRSGLDVYGDNVRVVVPIESERHGRVMVICVGAMMVGSTVITRKKGEHVKRAEELGYFKFGGSTILLLVEDGQLRFDQDLIDNSNGALETLVRVGMSIGHSPDQKPHFPDQRKINPSMEERQDAKRRIEGALAPTSAIPSAANMT